MNYAEHNGLFLFSCFDTYTAALRICARSVIIYFIFPESPTPTKILGTSLLVSYLLYF